MPNTDGMIADAVGVIIEKTLMEIGVTTHSKVAEILGDYDMTFSDCYKRPDVLNFALKQVFGNAYLSVMERIGNELLGFESDETIRSFIALASAE